MPGIYIRKGSCISWSKGTKDTALTVPGSYWLGYKQNIYKFILKYHSATRNIKKFNCMKELLQVIRKIIKNPPRQGQQFSTHHLLITFNHIAWNRQDKMFALLHFKQRSVSPFSHAYVLSIKICDPLEEQNSRYTIGCTYSVESSIHSEDENTNSIYGYGNKNDESNEQYAVNCVKNNFSKKSYHCDNIQKKVVETKSINSQEDNTLTNSNLKELFITKEPVKETDSNKNANERLEHLDTSFKLPTALEDIKLTKKIMVNNNNHLGISDVKNSKQLLEITNVNGQLNNNRKSGENVTGKNCTTYTNTSFSSNNRMINDNGIFDDPNVDSANLPYQYLIEKEIENTKQNSRKRGVVEMHTRDSALDREMNSDAIKMHDVLCRKQKKFALNNAAPSTNITNLVMEGLMFTVCQGPNAVGVIQQKSKVGIDNVLENSDKIKIKESGKCLHNSNLLGLENLITTMELPKNGIHESKYENVIGNNPILKNQSLSKHLYNMKYSLTNNKSEHNIDYKKGREQCSSLCNHSIAASSKISNNSGMNNVDKDNYFETYNNSHFSNSTTFLSSQDLNYKKDKYFEEREKSKKNEKEEDIIPKASLSFKENKTEEHLTNMPNKRLLMDDTNNKKLVQSEKIWNENCTSFSKPLRSRIYLNHECSNNDLHLKSEKVNANSNVNKICNNTVRKSNLQCIKNFKSNCPLVISEQTVTLNQIPLPLQTIIRNRLSMKHTFLNRNVETSESNVNNNKARLCKEQDSVTNTQLRSQIDENLLSTQHLKHHEFVNNDVETYNENIICTRSDTVLENLEESNIAVKKLSPNKITDITQQFYHDLSCFQRNRNIVNQKHAKQRQTSVNLYSNNNLINSNYGENYIGMVKLFQDITRGVKVVVKRISINKYS